MEPDAGQQPYRRGPAGGGGAITGRIRLRSALVAEAAAARVPVASLAPDSCVALAYDKVVELLTGAAAR
jgi:hypothetical protein